ncbi:MAG: hypothetical protein QOJ88_1280 [Pyrinomonadaceae bacterium]|nr:hypothetical protein [Pyrinomonadaceae bacterium]
MHQTINPMVFLVRIEFVRWAKQHVIAGVTNFVPAYSLLS